MGRIAIAVLSAASVFLGASLEASAQVWSDEKAKFVSSGLPALFVTTGKVPSIAVGVSINSEAVMTAAYGNAKPGVPATAETVYHLGSVSKQFTAAAVLAMIEDNGGFPARQKISIFKKKDPFITLATNIEKFFPAAKNWTTTPPITVRHLLNMQSGFPNYTVGEITSVAVPGNFNIDPASSITAPKLLIAVSNFLSSKPSQKTAERMSDYSNTNYFLLASIFDATTKVPTTGATNYKSYVRERIFKKADMTSTGFVADYAPNTKLADPTPNVSNAWWDKPAWPKGAGEVASNVIDMQKWHAALMGGKIIKASTRTIMFNGVAPEAPEDSYAMGWGVIKGQTTTWASHFGLIAGYRAYDGILIDDSKGDWVSVSLLTNSDLSDGDASLLEASTKCIALLAMDGAKTLAGLAAFTKAMCNIK